MTDPLEDAAQAIEPPIESVAADGASGAGCPAEGGVPPSGEHTAPSSGPAAVQLATWATIRPLLDEWIGQAGPSIQNWAAIVGLLVVVLPIGGSYVFPGLHQLRQALSPGTRLSIALQPRSETRVIGEPVQPTKLTYQQTIEDGILAVRPEMPFLTEGRDTPTPGSGVFFPHELLDVHNPVFDLTVRNTTSRDAVIREIQVTAERCRLNDEPLLLVHDIHLTLENIGWTPASNAVLRLAAVSGLATWDQVAGMPWKPQLSIPLGTLGQQPVSIRVNDHGDPARGNKPACTRDGEDLTLCIPDRAVLAKEALTRWPVLWKTVDPEVIGAYLNGTPFGRYRPTPPQKTRLIEARFDMPVRAWIYGAIDYRDKNGAPHCYRFISWVDLVPVPYAPGPPSLTADVKLDASKATQMKTVALPWPIGARRSELFHLRISSTMSAEYDLSVVAIDDRGTPSAPQRCRLALFEPRGQFWDKDTQVVSSALLERVGR